MTDLQVKYQALVETERANRQKEFLTRQQNVMNEAKIMSDIQKNNAQILQIQQDTELTAAIKAEKIQEIVHSSYNMLERIWDTVTGKKALREFIDMLSGITGSFRNITSGIKSLSD